MGRPKRQVTDALETVAGSLEELTARSSQPRVAMPPEVFTNSVIRMVRELDIQEPDYMTKSRIRDNWLSRFWQKEPHLAGVINSVVMLDANRLWTMTGPRNMVRHFSAVINTAESNAGWRTFMTKQAMSYYTTDLGSVAEIGRNNDGVFAGLFHIDSSKCEVTGNPSRPLKYYPKVGNMKNRVVTFNDYDLYRCTSMVSPLEEFGGLGYCAVSRVLQLAKIMVSLLSHNQEQLLAKIPRGLMLVSGISDSKWESIKRKHEEVRKNDGYDVLQEIWEIVTTGDLKVDLKSFSQIPQNFNAHEWVMMMMYGYSLAFGYDVTEFYPMESSAFGRGKETQLQARKASTKGELANVLLQQEGIQRYLPETVLFLFDRRDEEGEIQAITYKEALARSITSLYIDGLMYKAPIITRNEARQLLKDANIIPQDWPDLEREMVEIADPRAEVKRIKSSLRGNLDMLAAARRRPDEPIVQFSWPSRNALTICERADELLDKTVW